MSRIYFKRGYRYRLESAYEHPEWLDLPDFNCRWFSCVDGMLTVVEGYCWDGATSAIDSRNFLRGSLIHDVQYQAIREGLLSPEHRRAADLILFAVIRQDGMPWIRAKWVLWAVSRFGPADGGDSRPIESAP